MAEQSLKRNIFQRIFGISATALPQDPDCWTYADGRVQIDLDRAPELARPGGAVRLEKKDLPERVLVVHGDDGTFHAFANRCRHMGRRLDPVPGTETVQCCSVSKSTYDYQGKMLTGAAKGPVAVYAVAADDGKLTIRL